MGAEIQPPNLDQTIRLFSMNYLVDKHNEECFSRLTTPIVRFEARVQSSPVPGESIFCDGVLGR